MPFNQLNPTEKLIFNGLISNILKNEDISVLQFLLNNTQHHKFLYETDQQGKTLYQLANENDQPAKAAIILTKLEQHLSTLTTLNPNEFINIVANLTQQDINSWPQEFRDKFIDRAKSLFRSSTYSTYLLVIVEKFPQLVNQKYSDNGDTLLAVLACSNDLANVKKLVAYENIDSLAEAAESSNLKVRLTARGWAELSTFSDKSPSASAIAVAQAEFDYACKHYAQDQAKSAQIISKLISKYFDTVILPSYKVLQDKNHSAELLKFLEKSIEDKLQQTTSWRGAHEIIVNVPSMINNKSHPYILHQVAQFSKKDKLEELLANPEVEILKENTEGNTARVCAEKVGNHENAEILARKELAIAQKLAIHTDPKARKISEEIIEKLAPNYFTKLLLPYYDELEGCVGADERRKHIASLVPSAYNNCDSIATAQLLREKFPALDLLNLPLNQYGETLANKVANSGQVVLLEKLIKEGVDVNKQHNSRNLRQQMHNYNANVAKSLVEAELNGALANFAKDPERSRQIITNIPLNYFYDTVFPWYQKISAANSVQVPEDFKKCLTEQAQRYAGDLANRSFTSARYRIREMAVSLPGVINTVIGHSGFTDLSTAAFYGKETEVREILKLKPKLSMQLKYSKCTARQVAEDRGYYQTAKLIAEAELADAVERSAVADAIAVLRAKSRYRAGLLDVLKLAFNQKKSQFIEDFIKKDFATDKELFDFQQFIQSSGEHSTEFKDALIKARLKSIDRECYNRVNIFFASSVKKEYLDRVIPLIKQLSTQELQYQAYKDAAQSKTAKYLQLDILGNPSKTTLHLQCAASNDDARELDTREKLNEALDSLDKHYYAQMQTWSAFFTPGKVKSLKNEYFDKAIALIRRAKGPNIVLQYKFDAVDKAKNSLSAQYQKFISWGTTRTSARFDSIVKYESNGLSENCAANFVSNQAPMIQPHVDPYAVPNHYKIPATPVQQFVPVNSSNVPVSQFPATVNHVAPAPLYPQFVPFAEFQQQIASPAGQQANSSNVPVSQFSATMNHVAPASLYPQMVPFAEAQQQPVSTAGQQVSSYSSMYPSIFSQPANQFVMPVPPATTMTNSDDERPKFTSSAPPASPELLAANGIVVADMHYVDTPVVAQTEVTNEQTVTPAESVVEETREPVVTPVVAVTQEHDTSVQDKDKTHTELPFIGNIGTLTAAKKEEREEVAPAVNVNVKREVAVVM